MWKDRGRLRGKKVKYSCAHIYTHTHARTHKYTHRRTHTHEESYRLALSLSSPLASSASECPLRLPGFLCGALEFQTLIRSAGHFAPGPPPQACVGKWNCSGKSTGSILYCCQIPVRQTEVGRGGNKGWDLY